MRTFNGKRQENEGLGELDRREVEKKGGGEGGYLQRKQTPNKAGVSIRTILQDHDVCRIADQCHSLKKDSEHHTTK